MTIQTSPSTTKSSVLIIGATGFIGQFLATASLDSGRPTNILVRSTPICPFKAKLIKSLEEKGAVVLHGSMDDKEKMEKLLKEHKIDIVISAVGGEHILAQLPLVEAIKAVGTVKRFLPSEFGHDVDRTDPVEPGLQMYKEKRTVRRFTEEYGIPYTYICCNSIASWPYYNNTHPSDVSPPLDQFQIYGDGTIKEKNIPVALEVENHLKSGVHMITSSDIPSPYLLECVWWSNNAYFVAGTDIGKFTMKITDDVRTINKSVHFRPSCNFYNMNELAALWEKKIGRTLPRITVTEDDLLSAAAENRIPESIVASFTHDIFINGCQVNFPIDGANEVEVCSLYPDENFRSLDECFSDFYRRISEKHVNRDDENAAPNHLVESLIATCA